MANIPSNIRQKEKPVDHSLVGFWQLLRGFRLLYLGVLLSGAIATIANTIRLLVFGQLVDDVLARAAADRTLLIVVLKFVGLASLQGVLTFLCQRGAVRAAEGIVLRLRIQLFDHIQRLPLFYHDQTETGSLIQRSTSDVDTIRQFFAEQVVGLSNTVILFVVNFVALLKLDIQLALVSVAGAPLTVGLLYFLSKKVSKVYNNYQKQDAKLSTILQENLTGIRIIKAFARQSHERERFEQENRRLSRQGYRWVSIDALQVSAFVHLCRGQVMVALFIGGMMALNGKITLGTYLAFIGLIDSVVWTQGNLSQLVMGISKAMVSYKRVAEVLDTEPEPLTHLAQESQPKNLRGEIVFENVCFEYDTGQPILKDICLKCDPGQTIALFGCTGSGKTSLVDLLPRFYEYTSGSLTLDGIELRDYPRQFLRQQIGIVEQEPFLFSRSIRDNIVYGRRKVSQEKIERVARAAAIHETITSFPDGYDTIVGEKGATLSGGQRQRIAIARALLCDPNVLIFDSITSSVDVETERDIWDALKFWMKDRTTILITHRIQNAMTADRIVVFDQGQIVQQGTHSELIAQEGLYRQTYDVQVRIDKELRRETIGVTI